MRAGDALQAAAIDALGAIEGMAVFEGPPIQAAAPYAVVDSGAESDWSHKSGSGREVRLAVTIRDQGERPVRLKRLMGETETALSEVSGELDGWRLVTLQFLRSRLLPPAAVPERRSSGSENAWTGVVEYRGRLLADP